MPKLFSKASCWRWLTWLKQNKEDSSFANNAEHAFINGPTAARVWRNLASKSVPKQVRNK